MNDNYLVYKHTSLSGKMYIGITNDYSRRSREHRWLAAKGEGYAFHAAIRKYGWGSFKHEIIVENISRDEACLIEVLMIKELNTYAPNGYNMTLGADGMEGESSRKSKVANRKKGVKGYTWDKRNQNYLVQLSYLGKMLHFGCFKNESEAKAKVDYLFSLSDEELIKVAKEYKADKASRTKGYAFDKKAGKYQVRLRVDGKTKFFGQYATEQEAIDRVAQLRNEF